MLSAITAEGNTAIVLLDACRDNPFVERLGNLKNGSRSVAVKQGLGAVDAGTGVFIGFATQPGNVAYDGPAEHSPFAEALLRHMTTPAIDIEIFMRRVRLDVKTATGGRQVPWSNSSLVEPGFSFVPMPKGSNTDSTLELGAASDLEFWQSVKDANDRSLYQAYLASFPSGAFAAIAKSRIKSLDGLDNGSKKSTRKASPKPKVTVSRPSTKNAAQATTRSSEPKASVRSPTAKGSSSVVGGRCRDGNIERCRQNCRVGRQGACRMLRQLGG